MSNKFKVGDKVRVIEKGCFGATGVVIGDVGKIIEYNNSLLFPYLVEFDKERKEYHNGNSASKVKGKPNHCYWCSVGMLELVASKRNPIIIYQNGNEVVAIDKETGKKAVVKCCPDDTFDFEIGAKLAFRRLIGEKAEENKFVPHLICGGSHYGNIGEATNFLDAIGRQLCVGDVVEVYNEDLESCGNSAIVKENNEEFVTGIYSSSRGGKIKNGWQIIKARAYTEVEHNTMIDCVKYKKEAE